MKQLIQKISDAELEIMQALWSVEGPQNIGQIRQTLSKTTSWENSTVKTLVTRLWKKGVLKQEKREVFYYTPLVSREDYAREVTGNLIDRFYRGSAGSLVASLVRHSLSEEDREELREILKGGD